MNLKSEEFNRTILLVVTVIANFINPLMGGAVNIALPEIGREFSLEAISLSWITMAYLLASAVLLVPFGKVGDMFGRKKMFLLGMIVFGITTFLCAISTSGDFLITSRFLQGIGSAMIYSTSMAIIISAFPASERGKVIGYNVSAVYVGLSIAPILGGFLTETFGWRSLFFINSIVSFLIALALFLYVKAEWRENENDKFDWKGAFVYIPAVSALMLGFSKLPETLYIVLVVVGVVGLIIFVKLQLKSKYPLLNMKLFFENKMFASSNLSAFINYAATFAVGFVLSLFLQFAQNLSPQEAGMLLITQPVLMAFVAIFSGYLSDRINPKWLASAGMAISAIGILMLSFISKDTSHIYLIASLSVLGFGFGLFSSPNTNMVMSSVKSKYYGLASATLSTMRATGMMFSMAIATLSIHIFLGNQQISEANITGFIHSSNVIFIIFTILCSVGVFFSFVGKKETNLNMEGLAPNER